MDPKVGDKIKVSVNYMTPAVVGDTGKVVRIEEANGWPYIVVIDGREARGEFYFAANELEVLPSKPDPLELDRIRLIRIEKKLDRILIRQYGEVYDESDGSFKKEDR